MQAEIHFKESGVALINDLTQIIKSKPNSDTQKITDFNQFFLSKHANFTFVGKSETLTLRSDDILYVKFYS